MAAQTRIKTYSEFYRFYLTEHKNTVSRRLHFAGTALLFIILIYALATGLYNLIYLLPIVGYGFAWVGHFFFEKNKPATFRYPFWSLISDFKLFFEILTGKQKI